MIKARDVMEIGMLQERPSVPTSRISFVFLLGDYILFGDKFQQKDEYTSPT